MHKSSPPMLNSSSNNSSDPQPSCSHHPEHPQQQRTEDDNDLSDTSTIMGPSMCDVCGADITKVTQQVHYGARACFSCRNFFRRAQKAKRRSKWQCKKGEDCDVNEKTRRFCASCRYKRCITAGMKEDFVLTDDAKNRRFRKAIQKKRRSTKQAKSSNQPEQTVLEVCLPLESLKLDQTKIKAEFKELSDLSILKVMQRVHLGVQSPQLDEWQIDQLIQMLSNRFQDFAFSEEDAFSSLNFQVRSSLLAHNTLIYLQSVLCQYMTSSSGLEQASIVLGSKNVSNNEQRYFSIEDLDRYILSPTFGEYSVLKNAMIALLCKSCEVLRGFRNFINFEDVHRIILYDGLDLNRDCPSVQSYLSRIKNIHLISEYQSQLKVLSQVSTAMCCVHQLRQSKVTVLPEISSDVLCALAKKSVCSQIHHIILIHHKHNLDLNECIKKRTPHVNALLLARIEVAETLEEQLNMVKVVCTSNRREKVEIFRSNSSVKSFLRQRQKRIRPLLDQLKPYLNNSDLFLLLVLLTLFKDVQRLRSDYESVLSAVMGFAPWVGGYGNVSDLLEELDEFTNLCICFTLEQV